MVMEKLPRLKKTSIIITMVDWKAIPMTKLSMIGQNLQKTKLNRPSSKCLRAIRLKIANNGALISGLGVLIRATELELAVPFTLELSSVSTADQLS